MPAMFESPTLFVCCLVVMLPLCGYLIARVHYRERMREMHEVHEQCEDAAYRAGLERGRSDLQVDSGGLAAWYHKGFHDGALKERVAKRRLEDRVLASN